MDILSVVLSACNLDENAEPCLGDIYLQSVSHALDGVKPYLVAPNATTFMKNSVVKAEAIDGDNQNAAFWKLFEDYSGPDDSFVHVMEPPCILLPTFYTAMIGSLQFVQADYVFCHALCIAGEVRVLKSPNAGDRTFICSQILTRKWVLEELQGSGSVSEVFVRLISEYRGLEVPCILVTALS